jgi:HAD superfamily hydrolase (TIGR01509 family)
MAIAFDMIIFDCDGVLVDSEVLSVEAMRQVLNEAGVPVTAEMIARCFGMKQADILLRIEEETATAIPAGVAESLWPATRRLFERDLQPMPGIVAFLTQLDGVKRCVASSSNPERIRVSLALTGLDRFFGESIFSSHQVARGKPAPDLFLFAAQSMGAEPRRCIVIEDSIFGVQGARAAGMQAFGFGGGSHIQAGHSEILLAGGATAVEKSYEALARLILA